MIDVGLAGDVLAIIRQGLALLEDETDAGRGPELGEKFLAVMLHQLHRRFVQDQFLLGEGEENRAAGLALLRAGLLGLFGVHIDESDRRLRAVELRIARGDENDLSVSREKLDRLLVPEGAQRAGQLLFADRLQRAIEGEETRVAGEECAVYRKRFFGLRRRLGGERGFEGGELRRLRCRRAGVRSRAESGSDGAGCETGALHQASLVAPALAAIPAVSAASDGAVSVVSVQAGSLAGGRFGRLGPGRFDARSGCGSRQAGSARTAGPVQAARREGSGSAQAGSAAGAGLLGFHSLRLGLARFLGHVFLHGFQ